MANPPDCKLHRLVAVADIAAEVAADWVASQAIGAAAVASDSGGLYDRTSAGAQGFEAVAFWEDADRAVVHDATNVGLRPYVTWAVDGGSLERVAYADAAQSKPPGSILSFEDSRPSRTWLRITSATAPGSATHLAIYTREVP